MDLKEIQQLIKFVSNSGVDEVDIEQGDFKISIKKMAPKEVVSYPQPMQQQATQMPAPQPAQYLQPAAPQPETAATAGSPAGANTNLIEVRSPMIGTFYRSPSPDKPSFINVGDDIQVGDVLCIVEAMKLFNEIESEVAGKIVKVLVDDASPVEYDQPLFLVEPK